MLDGLGGAVLLLLSLILDRRVDLKRTLRAMVAGSDWGPRKWKTREIRLACVMLKQARLDLSNPCLSSTGPGLRLFS